MQHATQSFTRSIIGGVAALLTVGAIVAPTAALADTSDVSTETSVDAPVEALSEEGREWMDAEGSRHRVIYDRGIEGAKYGTPADGNCGPGWYLHGGIGTDFMDAGRGFKVNMTVEGRTRPSESRSARTYVTTPAGKEIVQGTWLNLYNWGLSNRVHIEMVCTQNPDLAWDGR